MVLCVCVCGFRMSWRRADSVFDTAYITVKENLDGVTVVWELVFHLKDPG